MLRLALLLKRSYPRLAGFGRSLLASAAQGSFIERSESAAKQLARIEFELRAAMFGIGASSLHQLRHTDRLVSY